MYHYVRSPASVLRGMGDVERQNPLPAGHYWIDVFGDNRAKMVSWMEANKDSVTVESTTEDAGQSWYVTQAITDWLDISTSPDDDTASVRYTFTVTSPVTWDGVTYGYPEIIPPGATTPPISSVSPSQSAAQSASPPSAAKPAKAPISSNSTALVIGALVVLGLTVTVAVMHKRAA